jgi:hypothetical protein
MRKIKKLTIGFSVVMAIAVIIALGLYFNIVKLPCFGHVIYVEYIGGLDDDRVRMGMSDFVFVGKVIEKKGYKKNSFVTPFTLYTVEVVDNIKGELSGNITAAQMGGYHFGVPYQISGAAEIKTGGIYLIAARYNEKEDWYVVDTHQSGSHLISENQDLSLEELKILAQSDEKYKNWQEAYKNEILSETDIKNGRVYNSYQLLYDQKQDNMIYYSSDKEYPLVLNQTAYPVNEQPEISRKLSEDDSSELSITPIMKVPENSWIFNTGKAMGTDDVYFVVNSMFNYWYTAHQNSPVLKNPSGVGVTVLSAFKYEPASSTITKLFDTTSLEELEHGFPAIKSVSADSRYLAFDVYDCWGCGAGHPITFIYDTEKKTGLSIGPVFEFKWLEDGNYQYKKYIKISCDNPFGCYKDPAGLPIIGGKLN